MGFVGMIGVVETISVLLMTGTGMTDVKETIAVEEMTGEAETDTMKDTDGVAIVN